MRIRKLTAALIAGTALATGPSPGSTSAPGAVFSAPQPRPPPAPKPAPAAAAAQASSRGPSKGLGGGGLATSPLFFAPYSSSLVVAADGATTLRLSANAANVVDDAFNPLDGAHVVFSATPHAHLNTRLFGGHPRRAQRRQGLVAAVFR